MRYPAPATQLPLLLLLAAATAALPMPSSLDLLSQQSTANANVQQAPLGGATAKPPLSFPVRPNPKGLIDYTRDMLDPILCPMAATGGGDSARSAGNSKRPVGSGAARRNSKAKGRGAAGDAGGLCAAWCARVKGEAVDGVAGKAARCDDSGSCVCADGTTLLS